MAAVVTSSLDEGDPTLRQDRSIVRLVINWLAHTDGSATHTTLPVNGTILRVAVNPATNAPDDNYDVTLLDEDGLDVLAGQGANRDTTNSEHFCPGVAFTDGTTTSVVPIVVAGTLALSVTNAGSGNEGQITIYLR